MKPRNIMPGSRLRGSAILPGDKSIAHRALILSAICSGVTRINNLPISEDIKATISVFKRLGIKIKNTGNGRVIVFGKGLNGICRPRGSLYIAESGTTFRLLLGVLAGQDFGVRVLAGESLSKRPMLRVTSPLRQMGAIVESRRFCNDEYPPIFINGGRLRGITYKVVVASAQVKSAILLAGLYAAGETGVIEAVKTRDHTERMLRFFKAEIKTKGNAIVIKKTKALRSPGNISIPGDFSSASFFIVACVILPGSKLRLNSINLNPTRLGLLKVLKRMGADISINNKNTKASSFEPVGDIEVSSSSLKATKVVHAEIPSLIDELPILMVASCFAKGITILEGIEELRFKETDRIRSMSENLNKMGADIRIIRNKYKESIVIRGKGGLKGAVLSSFKDHRTAMSLVIAAICASSRSRIDDLSCINKSFPGFLGMLKSLLG